MIRLGSRPVENTSGQQPVKVPKPRTILLRFDTLTDRMMVWEKRSKLRGTDYSLQEDLPFEVDKKVKQMLPCLKKARQEGMKASISQNVLIVEGNRYTYDRLNQLPAS